MQTERWHGSWGRDKLALSFCTSVLTRRPRRTGCPQVQFALLVKSFVLLYSYSENKQKQYTKGNRKRTAMPRHSLHGKFLIWLSILSHPFILIKINHVTTSLPLGHWKTISTRMDVATVTCRCQLLLLYTVCTVPGYGDAFITLHLFSECPWVGEGGEDWQADSRKTFKVSGKFKGLRKLLRQEAGPTRQPEVGRSASNARFWVTLNCLNQEKKRTVLHYIKG